jgi:hypothetical protein
MSPAPSARETGLDPVIGQGRGDDPLPHHWRRTYAGGYPGKQPEKIADVSLLDTHPSEFESRSVVCDHARSLHGRVRAAATRRVPLLRTLERTESSSPRPSQEGGLRHGVRIQLQSFL